jgi:oxepin-CoA hydrolase/3-oxo-5,6-dehydrosuberyl-CoA semialdehyde dehydrogenase
MLSADTKPKWGTMSSQHMIEHLEYTYRIASGEIQDFEIKTPEKILEKVHNTLYNYDKMPHEHMFPLAEESKINELEHENLEVAKAKMLESRQEYLSFFKENPHSVLKNAVFGDMNRYEWYLLERKHLNHHFEQFGLI